MVKKGLGKGLDALFENNYLESAQRTEQITRLRISEIEPNKNQPRKAFDSTALEALARSIKEHGILQPIIVKQGEGGTYQIVAGERRWRAARLAGLSEVPVTVMELNGQKSAEIALIENIQRENLNAVEEALGLRELMDRFEMTQEQAALKVGKSRSAVANALRLLALPEKILGMLRDGALSAGHARALLSLGSGEKMEQLADAAVREEWSVRQLEKLVQRMLAQKEKPPEPQDESQGLYLEDLEKRLTEKFGRKIQIKAQGKKGSIRFEYYDGDDLEALLQTFQI